MESRHMTQQTFSQFLGISSAALSSIFNGRTKPTLNTVEAIIQKVPGISINWLMTGTGSMYEEAQSVQSPAKEKKVTQPLLDFDTQTPESPTHPTKSIVEKTKTHPQSPKGGEIKISNIVRREITEIRVYFDDQTYETFVPDKAN